MTSRQPVFSYAQLNHVNSGRGSETWAYTGGGGKGTPLEFIAFTLFKSYTEEEHKKIS